jgi:hypothetical protein
MPPRLRRAPLRLVRVGLPAAIVLAGAILLVAGGDSGRGAGIVLIGVAGLVVMANLAIRVGLSDERERAAEERRREAFAREGRWPDDDDPA